MNRGKRATRTGVVVSSKMDKTVVVAVSHTFRHPRFEKYVRRTKKYYAHDETNACREGDTVVMDETRPMSKLKRWRVVKVLSHHLTHKAENEAL
jgi:small subunit ribosomal protein S17